MHGRKALRRQGVNACGTVFEKFKCSEVSCAVGDGERWGRSDGLRVLVLILRRATRQPAGGGSGGKLDSRDDCRTTDGRVEDGCTTGRVEDEGVGTDDVTGGGTGIGSGLHFNGGARMSTGGDVAGELSMTGPGLSLPSAPEVATSCNDEGIDNHGQDGRDTCRSAGPVHINKGDPVDRLIDGCLLMVGLRH